MNTICRVILDSSTSISSSNYICHLKLKPRTDFSLSLAAPVLTIRCIALLLVGDPSSRQISEGREMKWNTEDLPDFENHSLYKEGKREQFMQCLMQFVCGNG